jgi:hypothetical protein
MEAPCARRDEIRTAPAAALPPALEAHALTCPDCAEALFLRSLEASQPHLDVPPPGLLYWRTELRLRQQRLDAAMRPARYAQAAVPLVLSALAISTAALYGQPLLLAAAIVLALLAAVSAWVTRSA